MLKKILAASSAALVALSAVASTAMADDAKANASDYVLELLPGTYTTKNEGKTSAHITATYKSGNLADALAKTMSVTAKNANTTISTIADYVAAGESADVTANLLTSADAPAAGKYAYLKADGTFAATPTNATAIDITNGITQGLKLVKIKSVPATPSVNSIAGCSYEVVNNFVGFGAIEDTANPYNKLAMGLSIVDTTDKDGTFNVADWSDFKMTNVKLDATLKGLGSDIKNIAGGTEETVNVDRTGKGGATFANIQGGSNPSGLIRDKGNTHWTTDVKGLNIAFGISASNNLTLIKPENSEFTVEFDVEMSNSHWKRLLNAAGVQWDNINQDWTSGIDFSKLINGSEETILNTFLGIEGSSVIDWANVSATTNSVQVGGFGISNVSNTKASDVKVGEDTTTDHSNWFNSGVVQSTNGGVITSSNVDVKVGLGTTKNNILKNLNNGGTVTFTFDKDIRTQDIFNPYIIWKGASGLVNLPLQLTNTFEGNSKELTLSFPAGMTWAEGNTNFYNSFVMSFNLNYENSYAVQDGSQSSILGVPAIEQGTNVNGTENRNAFFKDGKDVNGKDNYNGKLVKITFKANEKAPADSNNSGNGGLVESDPSSSTPTSDSKPTNSGNSGNDNKNPSTGVAVAVAPVALAATAAFVVISKKRK